MLPTKFHILLVIAAVLIAAGPAPAALHVEEIHTVESPFDLREGVVEPSPAALDRVEALGATARWTRFGTIHTLHRPGDVLATGLTGEPAVAARDWIRSNRELFGLSTEGVDALELRRDAPLEDGSGRVLLFRQVIDGVPVGGEGAIKVGIVDSAVFWAASSAIGDVPSLSDPVVSARDAWLAAAADLGLALDAGDVVALGEEGGWEMFEIPGLSHPQRARLVALGIPGAGAVPAWETLTINFLDGSLLGYTHFVDAVSGAPVVGRDRVTRLAGGDAGESAGALSLPGRLPADGDGDGGGVGTDLFQGDYPPGQVGECGPCHGPFTAAADAGWDSLVFAVHHLTGGDITFDVFRDDPACSGAPVLSQDLLTTPETATVSPVAPGDYHVRVCPFDAVTNAVSGAYVGAASFQGDLAPNQNAKWRFFPASPPLDFRSVDTRSLGCWFGEGPDGSPLAECDLELVGGSSHGIAWDYLPATGTSSETTTGNAARSSEAWAAFLSPGEAYQPVVVSPDPAAHRVYDFPWTNQWFESACDPTVLTHSGGLLPDNDIDAAIANLFALHNQVHDWAYHLGYRERQGAAQLDNFGQTGPEDENDPELGNAQAGALTGGWPSYQGRDNANQLPTPEGVPPLTNMYLWQTIGGAIYVPCVDGDYDAGVIAHEYGHLIQHRMVDPDNGLSGDLGRAMGESWSDLTAIGLLNQFGRVPVADENPFAVGTYITDPQTGIRNFAMNESPLNLSNVGYDFLCLTDLVDGTCLNVTQVHADGEIWSAVNFDLRQAMAEAYDAPFPSSDSVLQARCASGDLPADRCPGNRRWSQIMHDAFLLMPSAPSMIDARDAYLAADLARALDPVLDWPSNQETLWEAFARRGFGAAAFAADGDDYEPIPDFSSPLGGNASVTFDLVAADEGKAPVVGEVYVGRFEARSTPLVDTDPATALGATAGFVPGTYEMVARADGYGHYRFEISVDAGDDLTATVELPTNWASAARGASVSGPGSGHARLIDDSEATNWEALDQAPSVDVAKPTLVVSLQGVHSIDRVQVSGMLEAFLGEPLQNRFSSIDGFRVLACNAAASNCSSLAAFDEILAAPEAFPAAGLRPLVGDMTVRSFGTVPVDATHLALEVLHNKCTGTPAYQGYLGIPGNDDADINNGTDCRTGSPPLIGPKNVDVRVAELQAFGSDGRVKVRRSRGR